MPDMLITGAIGGAFYGPLTSPSGYIALGASPPNSGAIRIDGATYNPAIRVTAGTTDARLAFSGTNGTLYVGTWSANDFQLVANALVKWSVVGNAGAVSTLKADQATARIAGGATSLAFRNNADNADNVYIADAGGILLRGATGGTPAVGVINAQGFKINGVDVGVSTDTYWTADASGIAYSAGNVGIGAASTTAIALNIRNASLLTTTQFGIVAKPVFTSAGTSTATSVLTAVSTVAAAYTLASGYGVYADGPTIGAGSAITTLYGVYAANQGNASVTNAYGVYIAAQSGAATTNTGLYNAGTTQLMGSTSIGGVVNTNRALDISLTLSSASQVGVYSHPVFSSAASDGEAIVCYINTAAAAFTLTSGYGLYVSTPTIGAGSSISTAYGIRVLNQGAAGVTNAYGLYLQAQSGAATTNISLYNAGTTQLVGAIGVNTAPDPAAAINIQSTLTTSASQYGINVGATTTFSSAATTAGYGLRVSPTTANSAFTMTNFYGIKVDATAKGAASTITNRYGVYIDAPTDGGTLNIGLYNAGTARLGTYVGINGNPTTTSRLNITGLPTSAAGLAAGDVWNNGGVLTIV